MSSSISAKKEQKHALILELSENFTKPITNDILIQCKLRKSIANGIGNRLATDYNYSVIRADNTTTSYSENLDDIIPPEILSSFFATISETQATTDENPTKTKKSGKMIIGVFFHSKKTVNTTRTIRPDILKHYKNKRCVVCATKATVCDHKNDLYNDPRVLNPETQTLDDFQPLCNHCNLQKRQVCVEERNTGRLYSAKNIPQFQEYRFEFEWEQKPFNLDDPDCKKGTYWYDPVEFNKKIYEYTQRSNTSTSTPTPTL